MRAVVLLALLGSALPAAAETVVLNGVRMHYEEHGRGEAVLFLHGFSLDSRMWNHQLPLAKKYRMVVADMRFHGRSDAPEGSTATPAEAADDIRALLDHLKVRQAHLVGLSMGTGYAVETALRYPERVLSLTLASPAISGVHTSFSPARKLQNASPAPARSPMLELGTCSPWNNPTSSTGTSTPS